MTHFTVALLMFAVFIAGPDDEKIPREPSDTSLIRIKADPEKCFSEELKIVGGIQISDYYNYGYENTEKLFHSISFREAGKTFGDSLGDRAYIYMPRKFAKDVVDRLVEASEDGDGDHILLLARVKVKLNRFRYFPGKQWNMLEAKDVQFFDRKTGKWGEWLLAKAEEDLAFSQKRKAEEEIREKEKQAKADKAREDRQRENDKARAEKEAAVKNEKSAEGKLKLARIFLKDGKRDKYRATLKEVVEKYPDTKAAAEAKDLLK